MYGSLIVGCGVSGFIGTTVFYTNIEPNMTYRGLVTFAGVGCIVGMMSGVVAPLALVLSIPFGVGVVAKKLCVSGV